FPSRRSSDLHFDTTRTPNLGVIIPGVIHHPLAVFRKHLRIMDGVALCSVGKLDFVESHLNGFAGTTGKKAEHSAPQGNAYPPDRRYRFYLIGHFYFSIIYTHKDRSTAKPMMCYFRRML